MRQAILRILLGACLLSLLVHCDTGSVGVNEYTPLSHPEPTPTPPRGLSCIHCLHPKARASGQVHTILGIMRDARISHIATNYLIDGTFGDDLELIRQDVELLTSFGSHLTLILYMSNGPWERRGLAGTPEARRRAIEKDEAPYLALLEKMLLVDAVVQGLPEAVDVILVPTGLEDNLRDSQAVKALGAASAIFQHRVRLGRNPCPGCWPGNQDGIPPGVLWEHHDCVPHVESDIDSNDGCDLTPAAARQFRDASPGIFLFWTASYQGIYSGPGLPLDPPDSREYEAPSAEDSARLAQLLRGD